tara:strand:+ start:476 stop:874 length:399 start_codon:yes stop_codon:yes gene_type:complete
MPTTTATLTLNTSEFSGGGAISKSTTLRKAGTATGIDQFTGISRVYQATVAADLSVVAAGSYADAQAGKVYIKNSTPDTNTAYLLVEMATDVILGRLYPGDWMFLPTDGTTDIKVSTSAANMYYEFGVFHEG